MFEKGSMFPSIEARDLEGRGVRVGDFSQKSHVILIATPGGATNQEIEKIRSEVKSRRKTWDWLHAAMLFTAASKDLRAGAYAIDRFGQFLEFFEFIDDVWDLLEKEFIYHEARHC